jgi:hypothetical protein
VLFCRPLGGGVWSGLGSTLLLFCKADHLVDAPQEKSSTKGLGKNLYKQRAYCMKSNRWHLKLKGYTLGPLTSSELMDLAEKGTITPETPVSPDEIKWTNAGSIHGLTFDRSDSPPSLDPTPRTSLDLLRQLMRTNPRAKIVIGAGAAIGFVILLAAAASIVSPSKNVAARTYDYWAHVSRDVQAIRDHPPTDNQSLIEAFRKVATSIDALPTAGVDQDAIKACLSVAALFRAKADVSETINSPTFFMEAFIRGAAGDPFGASLDGMNADNAVNRRYRDVQEQVIQTRAILSSRYGREFPAL